MLVVFTLTTTIQFVMGIVFIVLVRDSCEGPFAASTSPESSLPTLTRVEFR